VGVEPLRELQRHPAVRYDPRAAIGPESGTWDIVPDIDIDGPLRKIAARELGKEIPTARRVHLGHMLYERVHRAIPRRAP